MGSRQKHSLSSSRCQEIVLVVGTIPQARNPFVILVGVNALMYAELTTAGMS